MNNIDQKFKELSRKRPNNLTNNAAYDKYLVDLRQARNLLLNTNLRAKFNNATEQKINTQVKTSSNLKPKLTLNSTTKNSSTNNSNFLSKKNYKSNSEQLLAEQRNEPSSTFFTKGTEKNAKDTGSSFTKAEGNAANALLFG